MHKAGATIVSVDQDILPDQVPKTKCTRLVQQCRAVLSSATGGTLSPERKGTRQVQPCRAVLRELP